MIDLHHASQAEYVRLDRDDSATRHRGHDATLRENSDLGCRYVDLRRCCCVDQLIETHVEIGVSEQSILVHFEVVEDDATLDGGGNQSSLLVDGGSYLHLRPIRLHPGLLLHHNPDHTFGNVRRPAVLHAGDLPDPSLRNLFWNLIA